MNNVNPLYTLSAADAMAFESGLAKVGTSVAFSLRADETAVKATYLAAAPHYLESWGDVQMRADYYSLMQPTIRPLFDTRQLQEALLKWSGKEANYYEYIKNFWKANILVEGYAWEKAQHDGFYRSAKEYILAEKSPVQDVAPMLSLRDRKSVV